MFLRALVIAILGICFTTTVHADIITLRDMGNTIMPMREANISMEAETVSVVPSLGGRAAHCKFIMKSHSDSTIVCTVGFPINRPPWFPEFKVAVNGTSVPVNRKLIRFRDRNDYEELLYFEPDYENLNYPGFFTWKVEWKPQERVTIEIDYDAGVSGYIEGIVLGRKLQYIVQTGGYWRGAIGHAVISFVIGDEFNNFPEKHGAQNRTLRSSYPEAMREEQRENVWTELIWEFQNWHPDQDIVYELFGWAGVNGLYKRYLLPQKYLGDTELYDESYIERLTEIEFDKARMYYPSKADTTDRAPYKYAIAEILRNEILARNEYSFNANLIEEIKWAKYFMRYSKMGRYYSRSTLPLSEVKKKFNEYERKNYEFLGKYLDR